MRDHYRRTLPVACGTYVVDYDPTNDDANVSHGTETITIRIRV